jgi:hypothetical protein
MLHASFIELLLQITAKRYIPGFIPQVAVRDLKDHLTSQQYGDDAVKPSSL